MKKDDLAKVIVVAVLAMLLSYVLVNMFFTNLKSAEATVKTVQAITDQVKEPSEKVFHKDAINPAVQVFIGVENQAAKEENEKVNVGSDQ